MNDGEGNLFSNPEIIHLRFRTNFEQALSICIVFTNQTGEFEISNSDIVAIKLIVQSLKNNKTPGEDNINSELTKIACLHLIK